MVIKQLSSLCFLVVFMACFAVGPVRAGYEFNIAYNGGTMVVVTPDENITLFPRGYYRIVPIRDVSAPAAKMILRFFAVGNVTGCAEVSGMTVKSEVKKQDIALTGTDPELSLKKEKARYSNYDCDIEMNTSYFDLPIDILSLYTNQVKKISVRSKKYGKFMDLNVETGPSKLIFSSRFEPLPSASGVSVKMTYWLYPNGTYLLSLPGAKTGKNTLSALKEFGNQNGWVPLEEMIKDFRMTEDTSDHYYFFDRSGTLGKKVNGSKESVIVGQMQTTRTIYGAKGPVEEPLSLDVHAAVPGPYQ